jgi:hypothetical protein
MDAETALLRHQGTATAIKMSLLTIIGLIIKRVSLQRIEPFERPMPRRKRRSEELKIAHSSF